MFHCRQFCVHAVMLSSVFLFPPVSFCGDYLSEIPISLTNPTGDPAVYRDIIHYPLSSVKIELPERDGKAARVKIPDEDGFMRMNICNNAAEMKQSPPGSLKSINADIHQENEEKAIFSVVVGFF